MGHEVEKAARARQHDIVVTIDNPKEWDERLDLLKQSADSSAMIDSSIYDLVYEGNVDCEQHFDQPRHILERDDRRGICPGLL